MSTYNTSCDPVQPPSCPLNLDTSCSFYHLWGQSASALPVLGIANGTNLEVILETIDTFLGASVVYDYNSYNLSYLRTQYTITNNQQFAESVDAEFQSIITNFNAALGSLDGRVADIESITDVITAPNFTDPCNIGLASEDTLFTSMQKLINYSCAVCGDSGEELVSPDLVIAESASISAIQAAPQGHSVMLNAKISATSGNRTTIESDGLYTPDTIIPDQIQTLYYDPGTGGLSISGANTVTIPLQVPQVLGFDCGTKTLTLSGGGGSQNLSCLVDDITFTETTLVANSSPTILFTNGGTHGHTITAAVKISATAGNGITANADGLFITAPTYENAIIPGIAGAPTKWGGPLTGNTLVSGSTYDIGFSPRKFVVGNDISLVYGSADPAQNYRYMQVWVNYDHVSYGAHSLQSVLNYNVNNGTTGSSGNLTASSLFYTRYSISSSLIVPDSFGLYSSTSLLRLVNTAAGNITCTQGISPSSRAVSACNAYVVMESGYAGNTGIVSHVAVLRSGGFVQSVGGSDFTAVTNAYGLLLNQILEVAIEGGKFTNTYGIVQKGINDDSAFDADVTANSFTPSDSRIKSNVHSFDNALELLNCVEIKRFNIHRGNRIEPGIGPIAQQLKVILPELVRQKAIYEMDDFHVIDGFKLLCVAIKAIQELSDKVNSIVSRM